MERIAALYERYFADPDQIASPAQMEFFAPDVIVEQSASMLGTRGTFKGYAGLVAAAREAFDAFREVHFVPGELIDAGDAVLALVDFRGRGRESDVEVHLPVCHLWTLREGKIVAWRVFLDESDARAAAGLAQ